MGQSVTTSDLGAKTPGHDPFAPYLSRLHTDWLADQPSVRWRSIDGTLVFADVSGFTPLTERLSRRGKIGAEQLTDILNDVFGIALANSNIGRVAAFRGSEEAAPRLAEARAQFVAIEAENFVVEVDSREAERPPLAGRPTDALPLLEASHKRAAALGGMPLVLAWLERLWGCALAQVGQIDAAVDQLRRSAVLAHGVGAEFEIAMTLEALSRVVPGAEGHNASEEATAIFARLGVVQPPTVPTS
jgi:hypothetical protein